MSQPDLFTQPGQPEPQAAEPTGPALDWQEQPVRLCPVTGKPRPRWTWPTNYHTSGRRWFKKDGSTALEREAAKKQAQAEAEAKHQAKDI